VLRSLTGPAPLGLDWDIDGSGGGDFFDGVRRSPMMEIVFILPPITTGGAANRGQESLTSSAKNGVRLELTFWVTTQPISKVFHGFER
jgi:hypothetical protein